MKKLLIPALLIVMNSAAFGQSQEGLSNEMTMNLTVSLALAISIVVLVVLIYMMSILKAIVKEEAIKLAEAKGQVYEEEPSQLSIWWAGLTDAVPLEKESEIELDHNYDGIRELDNHLPPWWTALFYGTIAFSVVYLFVYHVSGSLPLQEAEYQQEIAAAAALKTSSSDEEQTIDENNIVFSDDPAVLASGKKVYERNCVACHKSAGEGGIGPNLTDQYWLHGGSIQDIYNTVKNGVPDKGMIAWSDVLSPSKMFDVTSYIQTLKGTNPPNAKKPQGELYVEKTEEIDTPADSTITE